MSGTQDNGSALRTGALLRFPIGALFSAREWETRHIQRENDLERLLRVGLRPGQLRHMREGLHQPVCRIDVIIAMELYVEVPRRTAADRE